MIHWACWSTGMSDPFGMSDPLGMLIHWDEWSTGMSDPLGMLIHWLGWVIHWDEWFTGMNDPLGWVIHWDEWSAGHVDPLQWMSYLLGDGWPCSPFLALYCFTRGFQPLLQRLMRFIRRIPFLVFSGILIGYIKLLNSTGNGIFVTNHNATSGWRSIKGLSIKYVTLQRGERVWESVAVCDGGKDHVTSHFPFFHNSQFYVLFYILSCIIQI